MKQVAPRKPVQKRRRGTLPTAAGFKLWLNAAYRRTDNSTMVMDMLPLAVIAWDNLSTLQRNNWTAAAAEARDVVQPGWSIIGVEGAQVADYIGQSPREYF